MGGENEIVEGHGRLLACKELGYEKVPVIRLDELSDEERKAYSLVHNKLTMNTDFDGKTLKMELADISMDMEQYGFFELTPPDASVLENETGGKIEDHSRQPVAVRIVFKNTREWKKNEEQVRAFVDSIEGVNISFGPYEEENES